MELRGGIFDLDGVIVDTAKYHFLAWKRLADEIGVSFTKETNEKLKGVSRMKSLQILLDNGSQIKSEEDMQELASRKNEWFVEFLNKMDSSEILPGVLDFIQDLKSKGIKIALGSASKNAKLALTKIGLFEQFEVIVDGTMVTHAKPNPEVFLKAAEGLNLEPKYCLVFEDAVAGVQAAHNGDMKCVGIGDPSILSEANLVIPSFENINWETISSKLLS